MRPSTSRWAVFALASTFFIGLVSDQMGRTAASFTANRQEAPAPIALASVHTLLDLEPGAATRPEGGLVTSGQDAGVRLNLGRVPDSRSFADVLRVSNTDADPHRVSLAIAGTLPSIASVVFEGTGATSVVLAPGESARVRVVTSNLAAGIQTGALLVRVDDDAFLENSYPLSTLQAPAPPASSSATVSTGSLSVGWAPSPATGVTGYNVYRAPAADGPYTQLNGAPVTATSFTDSSAIPGQQYFYLLRALGAGSPPLEGSASPERAARIPPLPSAVSLPATATSAAGWVSNLTKSSVATQVELPTSTRASDSLNIRVTGGGSVSRVVGAPAGGGTVAVAGMDLSALSEGPLTLEAWLTSTDGSGAVRTGTASKDTALPPAPSSVLIPQVGSATASGSNPAGTINRFNAGTVAVRVVMPSSQEAGTAVAEIQSVLVTASGSGDWSGGTGNVTAQVDAAALADGTALALNAKMRDRAGNESLPVAATVVKDVVNPTFDFSRITFTNSGNKADTVSGTLGATAGSAYGEIRDVAVGTTYSGTSDSTGAFTRTIGNAGVPRTLEYSFRDAAWNWTDVYVRSYASTGTGTPVSSRPK